MSRHYLIKPLKTKNKGKILKVATGKKINNRQAQKIQIIVEL